jgi:hypothetical protein
MNEEYKIQSYPTFNRLSLIKDLKWNLPTKSNLFINILLIHAEQVTRIKKIL